MTNVDEAISRLRGTITEAEPGEGKPPWLPLAEEIRDKLRALTKEIYHTVPTEIRTHQYRDAKAGGTNWEIVYWETGKHPAAGRMSCLEVALAQIESLVYHADEETRPPATPPKIARLRKPEEDRELEGRTLNEFQKKTEVGRLMRKK